MKKLFLALAVVAGFSITFYSITHKDSRIERYNLNPDCSKKIVASEVTAEFSLDKKNYTSINQLMERSDLIVLGEPLPDPVTLEIVDNKVKEKSIDVSYKEYITEYCFKIDKTILGDEQGTIKFHQIGKESTDGIDEYETKIKPGHKYLIFMQKSNKDESYHSTSFEDGIFLINNENKILSFSKNETFAKYDTIALNILTEDITNNSKSFKLKRANVK